MSNPFPARFDSDCQSCGDTVEEGELMFAVDGQFICEECAEEGGNICPNCGNFKKEEFDLCYTCHEKGSEVEDSSGESA